MKSVASLVLGILAFYFVFVATDPEGGSRPEFDFLLALAACAGLLSLALACVALRADWKTGAGKASVAIAGVLFSSCSIPEYFFWHAVKHVRSSAHATHVASNVKQISLALLEYEKQHGAFPGYASFSKEGKPLISWRVLVLPYLGYKEYDDLYKKFRLDEPWDSPHNLPLLPEMPLQFAAPEKEPPEPHTTFFQVLVGKGTVFEPHQRVALKDIPDGPSDTLLVAEGGNRVPWTKPEDLFYDPDGPLPKFGGIFGKRFMASTADGVVHRADENLTDATIRALASRNGNDKPGPDW